MTADAGYGSEENYTLLENNDITAFVKYNYFHKEQRDKKSKDNPFLVKNLHYNIQTDTYYCPMGQPMEYQSQYYRKTKTGFKQLIKRYQAKNCQGCPLRTSCFKAKDNRIIEINYNLQRLKKQAKDLLTSKKGITQKKRRCWDVEAVFGSIKQNMKFKRFMLRGKEKINVEIGLILMAHNLKKFSLTI